MTQPAAEQFEQYTSDVYRWAYRLLGRDHDALDVVQDVYLRWAAQCGRQAPDRPHGWLRRVTLNCAVDTLRRRRVHAADVEHVAERAATTDAEPGDRADLRSDLRSAIASLPEMQRLVLTAKTYEGLTFARLADDLGVAVPTVKTHYLRAVRAVRDRLSPKWSAEDLP